MAPSCVNSLYPSAEESWGGNDQNRAEKLNIVLTWFRPVTWSSGHLGRRAKFPGHPGDNVCLRGVSAQTFEAGNALFNPHSFLWKTPTPPDGFRTQKVNLSAIFSCLTAAWNTFEQCQVVVFIADDLGFLGPGSPDLVTELCPPQDTA